MNERRVAVTGAGGFIGRHVMSGLRSGGYQTIGLGRHPSDYVDVVNDLAEVESLRELFERNEVGAVVHCAWTGHPRQSAHDFSGQLSSNVVPTANLGIATGLAGVDQIVFISTGGAAHVGSRVQPPPAYGWAKIAAEHVLAATAESFGTVLTVLRPSAVYGPGQDPDRGLGAIAVFADRLLRGKALEVFGSLDQSRDFLHVRDLTDAIVRCLSSRAPGVFPLGGPEDVTIGSLISLLERASGCIADVRIVAVTGLDRTAVHLDSSALASAVGWQARTTVASSVKEVVDELRVHVAG